MQMIYEDRNSAQLECDINNRRKIYPTQTHGHWEVKQIRHTFWREDHPRKAYKPVFVPEDDELDYPIG